ncbi:hypothetical protein MVEN_02561500 [Mycena venus]|uniref:DUF6532 domain-containing protein n=1 Tax=Mycena venus TaxID=2733690 RepID=A0A8H6WSF8_9AGAR|nr:hypothetical protein MVEN_02561500 [Mycena venus]
MSHQSRSRHRIQRRPALYFELHRSMAFEILSGPTAAAIPCKKRDDGAGLFTDSSLSPTITMGRHTVIDSDASASGEESARQPTPQKKPRASRDDVSGNPTMPTRTRVPSSRKPSEKQSAKEKENLDAAHKRIQDMEKEILRMRKKVGHLESQPQVRVLDDGPESEDNDFDDSEPLNNAFTSAITPLGRLPVPLARPIVPLRKTSKANATQAATISSRAFKHLPELRPDERDHEGELNRTPPSPQTPTRSVRDGDHDAEELLPNQGTPGPVTGSKRPHPVAEPSSPASSPKRKKSKVKEPQFRDGFVPGPGAKPNASDYEPIVEAVLLRACAEYSARCVGLNGFPPTTRQFQWADECFNNACIAAKVRYKLLPRMIKVILKRGSHIRGKVLDGYRPIFRTHYGFQRGNSKAVIAANMAKAKALLHKSSFSLQGTHSLLICNYSLKDLKDPVTRTGYGENKIIADARPHYLFKNKKSLAAIFPSHFNPISPAHLALDFTILQSLTQEYSTGVHIPAEFTEKDMLKSYHTHLADIEKWIALNPAVTEKLRRKWYKRAAQDILPTEPEQDTHIDEEDQDALRSQLEGRTGDTDSEDESDAAAGED